MTKREIIEDLKLYNNFIYVGQKNIRNEKGDVVRCEITFKATNFVCADIEKRYNKVIHVNYDGYFIIIERVSIGEWK